jgi:hypothetical protein
VWQPRSEAAVIRDSDRSVMRAVGVPGASPFAPVTDLKKYGILDTGVRQSARIPSRVHIENVGGSNCSALICFLKSFHFRSRSKLFRLRVQHGGTHHDGSRIDSAIV